MKKRRKLIVGGICTLMIIFGGILANGEKSTSDVRHKYMEQDTYKNEIAIAEVEEENINQDIAFLNSKYIEEN